MRTVVTLTGRNVVLRFTDREPVVDSDSGVLIVVNKRTGDAEEIPLSKVVKVEVFD